MAAAGVAVAISFGTPARSAEPIRIGSFLAITGPAAFLGDPEAKTLKLYVDLLNRKGGIDGRKIELHMYDSALSAKKAITFVKRLIDQDKVDIIIGGTTTGETMAVIPIIQRAGIPFVSLGGASVIVKPSKKWVFKTPHTDRMAVAKVYADMKKRGISKIGLIAGSGGFDKSCVRNDKDLAGKEGITIVASESYGKGDNDMTPQLTKIKNAKGLQSILFCGFGAPAVIVTRNHHQLGIKTSLYHNHGSCSKKLIKGSGSSAEGVRLPCAALLVADQLAGDDPQKSIALDYAKAYTAAYKGDVSTFDGHAYDALMLVVSAIKRAKSTDKAKVRAELEKTRAFIGVDGIYTMSASDHMGLDLKSFKMIEVRNGDWRLLY